MRSLSAKNSTLLFLPRLTSWHVESRNPCILNQRCCRSL